jgi:hypothetical protein
VRPILWILAIALTSGPAATRDPALPALGHHVAEGLPSSSASDSCREPQEWAVKGTRKPVYNNKIFTQGFTYITEWREDSSTNSRAVSAEDRKLRDSLSVEVGYALANALTMWGSSLLLVRHELPAPLRAYVDTMSQCAGGVCRYTAPQAVRVNCRAHASLVIELYRSAPLDSSAEVAQAQLRGRTILLNARFPFVFRANLFTIRDGAGGVSLVPVIAHELGHTFGLAHAPTGEMSLMAESMIDRVATRFASAYDANALATVLSHHIDGAPPGFFAFEDCRGLKVGPP